MTDADPLLAQLLELGLAEAPARLTAIARERGAASLELLQATLEMPALAEATVDALAEVPVQEAWDILERVAGEGASRTLRKRARRAQHRLRSRGFQPGPPAPKPAVPPVEQARATFFDYKGAQMLHVISSAPLGLVRYAGFIVSPEGLVSCTHVLANRADLEAFLAEEDERTGEDMVEMDLAYVARRVQQGVTLSREQGKPLPEDYLEASRILRDAPADAAPEELVAMPLDQPVTPAEATELVGHHSMLRWPYQPEQLDPYVEEWLHLVEVQPMRTEEGVPNLGAIQSRGQMAARIITDLVDEAARGRLVAQLREQARLLYVQGEKKLAQVSLRCAAGLEQHPPADDLFLRTLVGKSMDTALRIVRQEEQEAAQGPWMSVGGPGGSLWVPRPAGGPEEEEEEEPPASQLWLPGQ